MLLKASYASLYAVDNNSQEEEEDEISTKGFSTDTTVTVAVLEPSRSQGGQAAPQPRKERLGSLPLPRQSKSVPMSEGIVGWRSSARRATVHPTTFLGGPQATKSSQVPQELKGIQNSRHFPRIGTLPLSSKQEVDKRRFSIPAAIKTLQQPNSNKLKPLTPSPSNSKSFNLFAPTTAKLHERKPPAPVKVTLPGSVVTWSNREQKAAPSVVVLDLDDTTEQPISRNGGDTIGTNQSQPFYCHLQLPPLPSAGCMKRCQQQTLSTQSSCCPRGKRKVRITVIWKRRKWRRKMKKRKAQGILSCCKTLD